MWDIDVIETPAAKLNSTVKAAANKHMVATDLDYELVRQAAANLGYTNGLVLELDLQVYVDLVSIDPDERLMPPEWVEFFRALGSAHGRAILKAYKIRNGIDEQAS